MTRGETAERAVVAGATGLVGRALVDELLADGRYAEVTTIGRRALDARHERLRQRVLDLSQTVPADVPEGATVAFCCLGTTIKTAGSQDAFRRVDHGLALRFARACRDAGVASFHVVSAVGADAGSRVFYSRVKGEMERDVRALAFPTTCVYRPSLLLGERSERRPGERAGMVAARALDPLLRGPLGKYRAVPAATVARAMARHARSGVTGFHTHPSDELFRLAKR